MDSLGSPIEEMSKARWGLLVGRVAIRSTELLTEMASDATIQGSRD